MPCTYHETPEEAGQRQKEYERRITQPYVEKLDNITAMLCAVMQAIDNADDCQNSEDFVSAIEFGVPNDARAWFKEHKAADEKRRDELRASALAKLSDHERQALGLD